MAVRFTFPCKPSSAWGNEKPTGIAIQKIIRVKQGDHTCRFSHAVSRVDRKLKIPTFQEDSSLSTAPPTGNSLQARKLSQAKRTQKPKVQLSRNQRQPFPLRDRLGDLSGQILVKTKEHLPLGSDGSFNLHPTSDMVQWETVDE